jgi:hypothetical protein
VHQFPHPRRLLVDLFEHKVRVPFLGRRVDALGKDLGLALDQAAVLHPPELYPVGPQDHDLAVFHAQDTPRQRQDRGQVRGDAGALLGQAHHQAGALFHSIQTLLTDPADDKGVIAGQVVVGQADSLHHVVAPVHVPFDRVHARLAVVGRAHHHALGDEGFPQLDIVDDVAVVRADQVAVRIEVRLGVGRVGRAEGGPAQLEDTPPADHLVETQPAGHLVHLADVLAQIHRAVVVDGGAAHRVVAAVR